MASDVQQSPFIKQLAANDRPTREKALSSLQLYLTSTRTFTDLELLKLWKGLFFCVWHTDRPVPQQSLTRSLSALLGPLPQHTFLPFLRAFWTTLTTNFSLIPSLRMDKYLALIRAYIHSSFQYLSAHKWPSALLASYLGMVSVDDMGGAGNVGGPLCKGDAKVPDGLRYHVLDVWVEEFMKCEGWGPVRELVMGPVRGLEAGGRGKVLRGRAREVLGDERSLGGEGKDGGEREGKERGEDGEESEGFEGFGD